MPVVRSPLRRRRPDWRLVLLALTAFPAPAAIQLPVLTLPPLEGEVAGRLDPGLFPGAPEVGWRATVHRAGERRRWEAALSAPGLRLRLTAELDARGDGDWSAEVEELDLAAWFPAVQPLLPRDFASLMVAGQLSGSARGRLAAGRLSGVANLRLRAGQVGYPPFKVRLEGVEADFAAVDVGALTAPPGQSLTWTRSWVDILETVPGRLEFGLAGQSLLIARGEVALLGGGVGREQHRGGAGENNRGYLEARGTPAASDQQVIQAENADRRQVYAAIAAETGSSADEVGRQRAVQLAGLARPGHWVQAADGSWRKK